jgi:hypothetical protein
MRTMLTTNRNDCGRRCLAQLTNKLDAAKVVGRIIPHQRSQGRSDGLIKLSTANRDTREVGMYPKNSEISSITQRTSISPSTRLNNARAVE